MLGCTRRFRCGVECCWLLLSGKKGRFLLHGRARRCGPGGRASPAPLRYAGAVRDFATPSCDHEAGVPCIASSSVQAAFAARPSAALPNHLWRSSSIMRPPLKVVATGDGDGGHQGSRSGGHTGSPAVREPGARETVARWNPPQAPTPAVVHEAERSWRG